MSKLSNIVEAFLADETYNEVAIPCLTKDKADELRDKLIGHKDFFAEVIVSQNLGMHLKQILTESGESLGWDYVSRPQSFLVVLTKKVHNGK